MRLPERLALAIALAATPAAASAADADGAASAPVSFGVTGYYYAMRDEPDFGVGVATLDRGPLHLEARWNYEARDAGSIFAGWKWKGGDVVTWEVTPIVGALFGSAHGVVPGLEASVAWREVEFYTEIEYVHDRTDSSASYWYAWSELGWKPAQWLRVGLVGQRTRVVETGRELQRGVFAQFFAGKATLGVWAFNPDAGSNYTIVSLGVRF